MTKMKAVGLYHYLPIEDEKSLMDLEVDKPVPGDYDLLIRVKANGVNPIDYKLRTRGGPVGDRPKILGFDVAGVVDAIGSKCTLFKVGDEVYYSGEAGRPGGNSEYHVVCEKVAGRKPETLTFAEAAALPLTSLTAYEGLFDRLLISQKTIENKDKTILIIGAAGGVGSMGTQLARNVGLTVIGTASREKTVDWVKDHGAEYTINHHEAFAPQLEKIGVKYVDYIFCLQGTDEHWESMAEVIAPQGKICSIVENKKLIQLGLLKDKSVTFVWEFMFTRTKYQTKDMIKQHEILNEIAFMIENREVKTTLNTILSPINGKNLRRAHEMLESGETIGKIVIEGF